MTITQQLELMSSIIYSGTLACQSHVGTPHCEFNREDIELSCKAARRIIYEHNHYFRNNPNWLDEEMTAQCKQEAQG